MFLAIEVFSNIDGWAAALDHGLTTLLHWVVVFPIVLAFKVVLWILVALLALALLALMIAAIPLVLYVVGILTIGSFLADLFSGRDDGGG